MKKYSKNKKILFGGSILILAILVYSYFNSSIPVRAELSGIQKIAQEYKAINGNFGIISDKNDLKNCFAGNTFVKMSEMNTLLSSPDVENISCVFQTASGSPVVDNWSITIVKDNKAYCEDSSGDRRETPGLTTSHLCTIEN